METDGALKNIKLRPLPPPTEGEGERPYRIIINPLLNCSSKEGIYCVYMYLCVVSVLCFLALLLAAQSAVSYRSSKEDR